MLQLFASSVYSKTKITCDPVHQVFLSRKTKPHLSAHAQKTIKNIFLDLFYNKNIVISKT